MEGWAGFTDEELRRMKGGKTESGKRDAPSNMRPPNLIQGPRKPRSRPNQASRNSPSPTQTTVKDHSLLPEQMLCAPRKEPSLDTAKQSNNNSSKTGGSQRVENLENISNKTQVEPVPEIPKTADHSETKADKTTSENMPAEKDQRELVDDDAEILDREKSSLQRFQQQQKMIEELNKKKKVMLATAIQQRQKKAKAEAAKLSNIQRELNHLDQMVNADVSIIRDRIEESSREYLFAQKRYDKAEKEYIESKMDLHEKMELKESLTEHLYTVIHQNEMRKAKKLAELMSKLDMESAEDIEELKDFTLPDITLLSQFQVSSPHSPLSPKSPPTSQHSNASKGDKDSSVCQQATKSVSPVESSEGQDSVQVETKLVTVGSAEENDTTKSANNNCPASNASIDSSPNNAVATKSNSTESKNVTPSNEENISDAAKVVDPQQTSE